MKVYMLGIGGVAMGNLASLLKQAGHEVTGVDTKLYAPMSDFLAREKISYREGYDAKQVPAAVDLVVVGNVIRSDNPEIAEIDRRGLKKLSLPQTIRTLLLPQRQAMVVAGTHGKTTTTSLLTHCLRVAGLDPGFLIGGIAHNLKTGSGLGSGKYFVLEGDEYDSAYFQKEPKFLSYEPHHLIITSVDFDHADIYADFAAVVDAFRRVAMIVPQDGQIFVCSDYVEAVGAARAAKCPVFTYGKKSDDDFQVRQVLPSKNEGQTDFVLFEKSTQRSQVFTLNLIGDYNVFNAAAVAALLLRLKIDVQKIAQGLSTFTGVQRRQQTLYRDERWIVIEDFAHHPTAIGVTLKALRTQHPKHEMWALFEPRSNTSRRNYFQDQFAQPLATADQVVLYKVYNEAAIVPEQRLNRRVIQEGLKALGKPSWLEESVPPLIDRLLDSPAAKKLVVIMTNGDFDGLKPALLARLQS